MLTKLVVISDTHNKHNQINLPSGDILIHCGDFSGQGRHHEVENFLKWFDKQNFQHKVYIAGNHDLSYEKEPDFKQRMIEKYPDLTYLEDSGVTINGLNFYGSPWQPEFNNWAFNLPRCGEELYHTWRKIPMSTDILITHGPPHLVCDKTNDGLNCGCEHLRERVITVRPKLHVFGHAHEGYGENYWSINPTLCVNASTCTLSYIPRNPPVELEI